MPVAEQADDGPSDGLRSPVERAMAELGSEWRNATGFRVYSERIVAVEGPAGYERPYVLRGGQAV